MKYITYTFLFAGVLFLASCGDGWSDNQKEAARDSMEEGFMKGLDNTGTTIDPKVKDAWLDCVMEKAEKKWTFDEFTDQKDELNAIQEECAKEVNLQDGMSKKE